VWTAVGLGFVALVVYLSLAQDPLPYAPPDALDHGHIVAYFWLMIWFAQIHHRWPQRLALAAAFGVLGIVLEFLQGMTGYRQFDYVDMLRDGIGIAVGLALAQTRLQHALRRFERAIGS